jgi:cytochrome P450 PksS
MTASGSFPTTAPLHELQSISITDPQFKANPFPFYAQLRAEAPVYPVTVNIRGKQRAWLITRYDDVITVLKDDQRFAKNPRNAMTPEQLKKAPRLPAMFRSLERNLLGLDGADHDRLKALVHKAFTPRIVEQMRDQTQAQVDAAIDRAERKGGMELISEFALPVPLTIIGRIIGVPEQDEAKFARWAKGFLSLTSRNPLFALPSILRFINYPRSLIKLRRAKPSDDLISAMLRAREGDDHLTENEIVAMVVLLLTAGHETTVNLIGSGTLALLQHPEQMAHLREDPSLIKPAIEELVRFVVPAETATERYAREDVTIAGTTIPKGELVLAVIASANRDPQHFDNPDTINLTREPNRHLSFGQGMHYCLGAPLSRLEGQIAINTLIKRVPNLRLRVAPDQLRWRGGMIVRGLESLPVAF